MIGDIFKFAIANIGRLTPFDYLLILAIAALLSAGIYLAIHSVYKQIIFAQDKLLGLKDRTIEHHEKAVDALTAAKAALEVNYGAVAHELQVLRQELETKDKAHNELVEKFIKRFGILIGLVLVGRIGVLQLHIIQAHRVRAVAFAPYGRLIDQKKYKLPNQIIDELDKLSERVFDQLAVLRIYEDKGAGLVLPDEEVTENVLKFLTGESDRAKNAIKADLDNTQPAILEVLENAKKLIGKSGQES